MASRTTLRASDADRDRVAERLRKAATEGRLLTEELEQRLESAFRARTYGQLERLIADLPGKPVLPRRRRPARRLPAVLALAVAVPVLIAVVAVVLQLAIGLMAVWWLWLVAGWVLFGRHRRCRAPWPGSRRERRGWGAHTVGSHNSWSDWA
ncbi:MAG: DUF1707 domain-containing protein [Solirubrobacteraceae bacterium]